jgi:hypothetical protein
MHWPQWVYIVLSLTGWGYVLAKHGDPRDGYDIVSTTIATLVMTGILYCGGFFG